MNAPSDNKRMTRERVRAEQARWRAAEKRKRTLVIAVTVGAVLAVAATLGILVGRHTSAADNADWSSAAGRELRLPAGQMGIPVRYGANPEAPVLTLYEDFRCPLCRQVETALGPTIRQLADAGTIRVEFHIASFLDEGLGGTGSRYAANAAGCAQDAGKFTAYHDVLFAHQPPESDDGFGRPSRLLDLANQVDGLRSPAFDQCVRDLAFAPWVEAAQADFDTARVAGRKVTGTPTVSLNDKPVTVLTRTGPVSPEAFTAQVDAILSTP